MGDHAEPAAEYAVGAELLRCLGYIDCTIHMFISGLALFQSH